MLRVNMIKEVCKYISLLTYFFRKSTCLCIIKCLFLFQWNMYREIFQTKIPVEIVQKLEEMPGGIMPLLTRIEQEYGVRPLYQQSGKLVLISPSAEVLELAQETIEERFSAEHGHITKLKNEYDDYGHYMRNGFHTFPFVNTSCGGSHSDRSNNHSKQGSTLGHRQNENGLGTLPRLNHGVHVDNANQRDHLETINEGWTDTGRGSSKLPDIKSPANGDSPSTPKKGDTKHTGTPRKENTNTTAGGDKGASGDKRSENKDKENVSKDPVTIDLIRTRHFLTMRPPPYRSFSRSPVRSLSRSTIGDWSRSSASTTSGGMKRKSSLRPANSPAKNKTVTFIGQ